MTQPTFALPCEYGLEVQRTSYGAVAKFAASSGTAVPSGTGQQTSTYEIKTVPIDDDIAVSLDSQLTGLNGSFFLSQFYFDDQPYKYRIVDDTWTWQVIGPAANIFTLNVERLQDATVEFPLDYGQTLENGVGSHFFRIATTSGTATPSTTVYQQRRYSVATRTLSKQSAQSLETTLRGLGGAAFYSQVYLDSNPRLYKLEENSWRFETQGENAYKATFSLLEVYSSTTGDYPCAIAAATLSRTSYGERIKLATTSGNATPGTSSIVINNYDIKTLELTDVAAGNLEASLSNLSGSYFFGKFYYDAVVKKYRIIGDTWERIIDGKDANTVSFVIEEVYEPTVEFAIDYDQSQEQQVSVHIFRIASSSGTATPASSSRAMKTASVRTRPMSKTAATALETTLLGLNGAAFYSQIYLDSIARLYRLQPYQWTWTPAGEDAYVCEFTMVEVIASATDIPCVDTLNLERTSRVKMVQFGDGYQQFVPDGINTEDYRYSIETLPLSDAQSAAVEAALSALKGNIFYAKFKNDSQVYKYRLDGNRWSWRSSGQNANVFEFAVKRAYDL